ncbi:MAG: AAA family ATPase [Clostridia bacterium]|nr:AAA family ATPase [Clostridia bacterium]
MQLQKVKIHNFRSILDADFDLEKYSLLVGENNAGKTNVITALRIFYEDDIKFDVKNDFPKCNPIDKESWIELEFLTTDDEQKSLKDEYKSGTKILKVRKYLKSENAELVKSGTSNIFAYESGVLSTNQFYGAKNISQAKLGRLLFIPELSKTDDNLKMSGPSPLRNMIDFVMQKVIKNSPTYSNLQSAFETFNKDFKEESSKDGFSLKELANDINKNVAEWGINFGLDINSITADNIIKNLVSHYIEDKQLNDQRVSINCFGQGLQRHLIYTLIRVGAKYIDKKEEKKKEFSPELTIILFEEPEAFLHPTQQELLNVDLQKIAEDPKQQILSSTHSAIFVSKNVETLSSLLKVVRNNGESKIYQINKKKLADLFNKNNSMFEMFSEKLKDAVTSPNVKKSIENKNLGSILTNEELKLEEESLKYFLWLDSERSCSFFAKHVFICEGATEKIFFDHLLNTKWLDLKTKHLYFLDAMGKYNIHRYMNLFGELGIYHSVIFDKDQDKDIHKLINDFIDSKKNAFTKGVYSFEKDIEDFVGITKARSPHLKPLNIMWNYKDSKIDEDKISELKVVIESLLETL